MIATIISAWFRSVLTTSNSNRKELSSFRLARPPIRSRKVTENLKPQRSFSVIISLVLQIMVAAVTINIITEVVRIE